MNDDMSYVGRKSCGCVVCAIVDDANHKRDIAREIAAWIKNGLTIERVTHDYVRQHFTVNCPHQIHQMELPL